MQAQSDDRDCTKTTAARTRMSRSGPAAAVSFPTAAGRARVTGCDSDAPPRRATRGPGPERVTCARAGDQSLKYLAQPKFMSLLRKTKLFRWIWWFSSWPSSPIPGP